MPFANPNALVETDWLTQHLDDADLRIFDCTVYLHRDPETGFRAEPGRDAWAEAHIPGSGFIDLAGELSDPDTALRFMMPPVAQFEEAMGRYGVGNDARVILYDRAGRAYLVDAPRHGLRQRRSARWGLEEVERRGASRLQRRLSLPRRDLSSTAPI